VAPKNPSADPTRCTKRKKNGDPCRGRRVPGLDACYMHCGKSRDKARADGQANLIRQRFRDVTPDEYVDAGDVLTWAVTVAYFDVADYRRTLKDRTTAKDGAQVTADELDRLMRMEADVARMGKMATDAGVSEQRLQVDRWVAEQLVSVLRGVVTELGHDPADPDVAATVRRHLELVPRKTA
jgi:hypothetical protein